MARPSPARHLPLITHFSGHAMDASAAERFRRTRRDDRGGAVRLREVAGPGLPCRHGLRLGTPGEAMLLASRDLPPPQGPYRTPSPVLLHAGACPHALPHDALPRQKLPPRLVRNGTRSRAW
jgi:hypothetical protein